MNIVETLTSYVTARVMRGESTDAIDLCADHYAEMVNEGFPHYDSAEMHIAAALTPAGQWLGQIGPLDIRKAGDGSKCWLCL